MTDDTLMSSDLFMPALKYPCNLNMFRWQFYEANMLYCLYGMDVMNILTIFQLKCYLKKHTRHHYKAASCCTYTEREKKAYFFLSLCQCQSSHDHLHKGWLVKADQTVGSHNSFIMVTSPVIQFKLLKCWPRRICHIIQKHQQCVYTATSIAGSQ